MTGTAAGQRTGRFIATKEHRRFIEFADAVRRHRYIGLCCGPAGLGKTHSTRRYARWDLTEPLQLASGVRACSDAKVYASLAQSRSVFYTPAVGSPFRVLRDEITRLMTRSDICIGDHVHWEETVPTGTVTDTTELLILDEAERLSTQALERVRDVFDRNGVGVILIGMTGLEKRLARYLQVSAGSASPIITVPCRARNCPSSSPGTGGSSG